MNRKPPLILPVLLASLAALCLPARPGRAEDLRNDRPVFRLSLHDAVVLCLKQNVDIQSAGLDVGVSELDITVEKAKFDPRVTATGYWQDNAQPVSSPFYNAERSFVGSFGWSLRVDKKFVTGTLLGLEYGMSSSFTPDYDYDNADPGYSPNVTLRLNQPLLKGGWVQYNSSGVRLSRERLTGSRETLRVKSLGLALQTSIAYWDVARTRESLVAAQQSLKRAEEFLEIVRQRVAAQTLAQSVLPDAQANLETQLDAVYAARIDIRNAEERLKRVMNLESDLAGSEIDPTDTPKVSPVPMDISNAERTALENRPELRVAASQATQARILVQRAKNEKLPELDLTAFVQYSGLGSDLGTGHTTLANGYYRSEGIGLIFKLPIGERSARAALGKSEYQLHKSRLSIHQTEQQVVMEVRQFHNLLPRLQKQVEAALVIQKARQESLDRVRDRFDVGQATSLDVVTAQEKLAVADRDLIFARVDYNTTLVQFYAAAGILLQHLGIRETAPSYVDSFTPRR